LFYRLPCRPHDHQAALVIQEGHLYGYYLCIGIQPRYGFKFRLGLVGLALVGNHMATGGTDAENLLEQLPLEGSEGSEGNNIIGTLGPLHLFLDDCDIGQGQLGLHGLQEAYASGHAVDQGYIDIRPGQSQGYARQTGSGAQIGQARGDFPGSGLVLPGGSPPVGKQPVDHRQGEPGCPVCA
jgi:hypothetical protein